MGGKRLATCQPSETVEGPGSSSARPCNNLGALCCIGALRRVALINWRGVRPVAFIGTVPRPSMSSASRMESAADVMALANRLRAVRENMGRSHMTNEYLTALDALLLECKSLSRAADPRSYKPSTKWESTPNLQPLTTTSRGTYIEHPHSRRQPYLAKVNPTCLTDKNQPFITRTTSADSFKHQGAMPRVKPILPHSSSGAFELGRDSGTFTTTSRASYTPHRITPFVAARGPKRTGGAPFV